jgi:hypothetical protein
VPAAQNFLPDKRDHDGVINIVVCGIAGRDIFKSKLGYKTDHARIAGLHRPVCSFVHRPKFADEGFYNYQCGVEHVNQPRCTHIGGANGPKLIMRVETLFPIPATILWLSFILNPRLLVRASSSKAT